MNHPPLITLTNWSVGYDASRPTVTLHLGKDEASAWAVWLLERELVVSDDEGKTA